jgi:hypothetical protein
MHGVVRRYSNASALITGLSDNPQEIEELLTGVPGFRHYFAVRSGEEVATVTICDDEAGTAESSRRAREWVQQNLANASIGAVQITDGEVFMEFSRNP